MLSLRISIIPYELMRSTNIEGNKRIMCGFFSKNDRPHIKKTMNFLVSNITRLGLVVFPNVQFTAVFVAEVRYL